MIESLTPAEQTRRGTCLNIASAVVTQMGARRRNKLIIGPSILVGAATIESLSEQRAKLKKQLFVFQESLLETLCVEQLWIAEKTQRLWQQLRLTSYLIAKLKLIWRSAISSAKKAVSERRFFVLHETHPPELSGPICGLLAGALQAA